MAGPLESQAVAWAVSAAIVGQRIRIYLRLHEREHLFVMAMAMMMKK